MSRNEGWVSVGIDHDTAQFAAQAIGPVGDGLVTAHAAQRRACRDT